MEAMRQSAISLASQSAMGDSVIRTSRAHQTIDWQIVLSIRQSAGKSVSQATSEICQKTWKLGKMATQQTRNVATWQPGNL